MVNFVAMSTGLEVVVELVCLFAVATYFRGEFLACATEAQGEVLCDLAAVEVALVDDFLVCFALFLLERWTAALTGITSTPFHSTICAHMMLVAFGRTTIMLHTYCTVKNYITVPVVVVTR